MKDITKLDFIGAINFDWLDSWKEYKEIRKILLKEQRFRHVKQILFLIYLFFSAEYADRRSFFHFPYVCRKCSDISARTSEYLVAFLLDLFQTVITQISISAACPLCARRKRKIKIRYGPQNVLCHISFARIKAVEVSDRPVIYIKRSLKIRIPV